MNTFIENNKPSTITSNDWLKVTKNMVIFAYPNLPFCQNNDASSRSYSAASPPAERGSGGEVCKKSKL